MLTFDFRNCLPENIHSVGGCITVTNQQTKRGKYSLQWDFQVGDKLVIDTDIGYKRGLQAQKDNRKYTFGVYIFGFQTEGSIHIGFEKCDEEKVGFDIQLGFSGWRFVTACFERDMQGQAEEGMNRMTFTAKGTGRILLDDLITAGKMNPRDVVRSEQVPLIQNGSLPIVKEWKLPEEYRNIKCDKQTVDLIKNRALEYLNAEVVSGKAKPIEELLYESEELDINYGKFGFCGKRVEPNSQRALFKEMEFENDSYIPLGRATKLLLDLAICYQETGDEKAKEEYIKILSYLISQGFEEGSIFGSLFVINYFLRSLYASVMLMHKTIKAAGLLPKILKAMRWFLAMSTHGFVENIPAKRACADDFCNVAQGTLYYILMHEEDDQGGYLKAFSHWLDMSMNIADGLNGVFKEDGCIYHHCGHYIAYGMTGLRGLTPVLYMLSGTAYDVSEVSWQNVKRCFSALHFQCWGTYTPVALSGRHPLGNRSLSLPAFKYFALSGEMRQDKEAVGMYLDLVKCPQDSLDERLFKSGICEEPAEDNRSFPMGCFLVHRRKGFMALAKGFSKYLWGSEIYKGCNLYGRYRSYGVLELFTGEKGNGFSHDGFDWNRFPGATTIHLPFSELKARVYNVDTQSGFEETLLSDQSFAGGVSLNRNGMFSMILTEHPKYNGSHKAHKSIFFHNNFILLLGSNICNDNNKYETETTLYQCSLEECDPKPQLNGTPFDGCFTATEKDVVTDVQGNRYYFKTGTHIQMEHGLQISQSSTGSGETAGVFATAVICHGKAPQNASYEYGIGVGGAEMPDYRILRQDDVAHVVQIGKTTYMSIFKPEEFKAVKTNIPLMLMTEKNHGSLEIAVCNPDLGLYEKDDSQYDEKGERKEVSIYSREWIYAPVRSRRICVEIKELDVSLSAELKGGSIGRFNVMI